MADLTLSELRRQRPAWFIPSWSLLGELGKTAKKSAKKRLQQAARSCIGGRSAPVAQLDRVLDYESRGRGFESSPVRHFSFALSFAPALCLRAGELVRSRGPWALRWGRPFARAAVAALSGARTFFVEAPRFSFSLSAAHARYSRAANVVDFLRSHFSAVQSLFGSLASFYHAEGLASLALGDTGALGGFER